MLFSVFLNCSLSSLETVHFFFLLYFLFFKGIQSKKSFLFSMFYLILFFGHASGM